MSDAVIEAAHQRYVEACWDDLEARWRLRAGGRLIVRGHSRTGGTVADTKVGETLDGMTVEQLRDLARRAEAAAKAQEEKEEEATIVMLGSNPSTGTLWRVRRGQLEFYSDTGCKWLKCHQSVYEFLKGVRSSDFNNVVFLTHALTKAFPRGVRP